MGTHPDGLARDKLASEPGVSCVGATRNSLRAYDVAERGGADLKEEEQQGISSLNMYGTWRAPVFNVGTGAH